MPYHKRPRLEPTEDWPQLQLQLVWPEQVSYELIRPVVLFGFPPAERAEQTGVPERTIYRKADRFDREGLVSLFELIRPPSARALPAVIRRRLAPAAGWPRFNVARRLAPRASIQWSGGAQARRRRRKAR
jgi:hypothetical protein